MTLLGGLVSGAAGEQEPNIEGQAPPSQKLLDWLHGRASTTRKTDIHHAIGFNEFDAAAGNHTHNGKDSLHLFTSVDVDAVTGASTTAQLAAAITKLNTIIKSLSD